MRITKLKTNHMSNPIGFAMTQPVFSYVITECGGKKQQEARIQVALDAAMEQVIFDSGIKNDIDSIAYKAELELKEATRYFWKVYAKADNGEEAESEVAYFETAKAPEHLKGSFIAAKESHDVDYFSKEIVLEKKVKAARAYATALGVYELCINGKKAGNEYLTPGSNDYDSWLQYQTYDVTELFKTGENTLVMTVAPGWYSGYFGFANENHIYGDEMAVCCDIDIFYEDGTKETICTDESWQAGTGPVTYSEIYHGEVQESGRSVITDKEVKLVEVDRNKLSPRRSLPVVVKEVIKPRRILHTPAGETVIDMGQNMAGWLYFTCREPVGTKLFFQYGEILQDGNFYRENLRTAKAQFTYISDGTECRVRPHFTYYGFRYIKVQGNTKELDMEDFFGEVVYSDMEITGQLETSNPLVNRLILNTLWGQKGNFVEVPTDCPQRDERMGWTGDAQVFCGTAAFQMDVSAFFSKFGYDMMREQEKYEGCVPMVIPSMHMGPGGSAAWADAATIIPWTVYLHSGDKAILEQQYPSMKMWADYIRRQDEANGGKGLWNTGFHFGDWLALDADDPSLPTGATERYYVASCYYYMSTILTAKAAKVLGKAEAAEYFSQAEKIKAAIQEEYFTRTGRLAITTQTGYVMALAFDICPEEFKERVSADLHARLEKDNGHLKTGFVGTPYLCKVLSEYGYNEMAYRLLLNDDCPSWLYPVRMGATTIWERWNSVMPDGKLNPEGMNSLNHYSYGAVVEWMYRHIAGIQPREEAPGFRKVILAPKPDYRMSHAKCCYDAPVGRYESEWSITGDKLNFRFVVPFGAEAEIQLPDAERSSICGAEAFIKEARQEGTIVKATVEAGIYELSYQPVVPYRKTFGKADKVQVLMKQQEIWSRLTQEIPSLNIVPLEMHGEKTLLELAFDQMCPVTMEDVEKMEVILKDYVVEPDQIPEMIMDI